MVQDYLENKNSESSDDFEKNFKSISKQKKMSEKEVDLEFQNINLDNFNK